MTAPRPVFAPTTSLQIIFPGGAVQKVQPWPQATREVNSIAIEKSIPVQLTCKRLGIVANTPLLHLDIRTPFGEIATDEQVEAAMRLALGPKSDSYHLIGWHLLRVEDSHVGSNHRILASLEDSLTPRTELNDLDFLLPIELGLWGLGNHIGQKDPGQPWQLILSLDRKWYSAVFLGTDMLHVRTWGADHPSALEQITQHGEILRKHLRPSDSTWIRWIGPGFENAADFPASEKVRSWLQGFIQLPSDESAANRVVWAFGFAESARHSEALVHNQMSYEALQRLRAFRMRKTFLQSVWISSISLLFCALFIAADYGVNLRAKENVTVQARGHQKQVQALSHLRQELVATQDSISDLGALARRAFPISILLSEISHASEGATVQALQVNSSDTGSVGVYLRAFTSAWENVEGFRKNLATSPGILRAEVSEQRKDASSGKVFFDLRLEGQSK